MTSVDLRSVHLRPGEVLRKTLDLELETLVLGGEPYEPLPQGAPAELEISEISGGTLFRLSFGVSLSGACMRCLGPAAIELSVSGREIHDPAAGPGDELSSEYVHDDRLDVSAWARDAVALALPEQILCRSGCAGLCPACGKDLHVEPHEHDEREPDPRWAVLQNLREEL